MSLPMSRSRVSPGILVSGCSLTFALIAVCYGYACRTSGPRAVLRSATIAVLPARDDGAQGQPAVPLKPPTALTVNVDTTQAIPPDPQALASALEGTPLAPAVSNAAAPPANWLVWGYFGGLRAPISLSAPGAFEPNLVGIYAANSPNGKTVCLVNRSREKLQMRVQIRLPRGIYTIERLSLVMTADHNDVAAAVSGGTAGRGEPVAARVIDDAPSADSAPDLRLERMEGRDLRRAAVVAKSGVLEPGQVVLYRCVDQSRVVDAAFADAYRLLALLEAKRPGPAHRLRRMLREGDPYRGGARPGGSLESRLESIHQLLLVTGQAQSLHHNYQLRGTVEAETGAALMGSLERAIDGLAEISATLLNLVPQIRVEPESGRAALGRDGVVPAAIKRAADSRIVTVALANGGEHAVEMVKLGLDSSELPTAIVCDPPDPAFFGTLKPGQTVRATFRLRCPSDVFVNCKRCVADVCYRAGGGPAHLRVRPW